MGRNMRYEVARSTYFYFLTKYYGWGHTSIMDRAKTLQAGISKEPDAYTKWAQRLNSYLTQNYVDEPNNA